MYHTIRWTSEKIRQRLQLIEPLAYRRRLTLPPFRCLVLDGPTVEAPVAPEVDDSAWPAIPWESEWGRPNLDFVLRTRFQVPASWAEGDGPLALYLPIGRIDEFSHPEALAYLDGQALASCDRHHEEILLPQGWVDGASHVLALHGWTGGAPALPFDLKGPPPPPPWSRLPMGTGQLVQIDPATHELLALGRVALGVTKALPEREPAKGHLTTALDDAFKVLDTREPLGEAFYASVPAALAVLRAGIERSGSPLDVEIWAAGHAHIDVAWLWTLAQTRLKAGRTFYNVVRLMERFPAFHFVQSQAQLYEYVRRDYPALFEDIAGCVADGRWEPVGGMWVEADCNVTGGESLARQFLLGTGFFRRHFGRKGETPVLWLPDVFGFPGSLPQLAREAGQRYFFTTKMGWSQYNRFPYDSFWWQGLDGTRLLAHFSPSREGEYSFAGTYNALATPETVLNTWDDFQQKDWGRPGEAPPLLMVYGHGDGGGGPTAEMVENIEHMGAFPATPRTRCGPAAGFFRELEERSGDRLPTWNGELYLEFHRGTYTTQARNKRANRQSEFLLHDAEFLAALAATLDPDVSYPHERLRQAWQTVCLNQFHDIIPGSSIAAVYAESLVQYAAVQAEAVAVRDEALSHVAAQTGGDMLLVNPTSFERHDLAFWPKGDLAGATLARPDGHPVPVQPVDGGLLLDPGLTRPYSITPLHRTQATPQPSGSQIPAALTCTPALLENAVLRVELDEAGDIVRIYDKLNEREVLPPGGVANQLQAYEDRPRVPDAWDIDIYYDDRCWPAEPASEVRVVESGPLRACLEVRRRVLSSDVVQRISLAHNSPRLDFDTGVEWRERHILLKVAFPLDVLAPAATYEIQWGNVQRPTHRNTSWDWARFEVPAQKWVDLSEGGYGASLLNDGKYGHDVHDNVVRLTLLRSPTTPDPTADLGHHRFTYSLLPHAGGWDEGTVCQAYALNDPLVVWPVGRTGRAAGGPAQGSQALSFLAVDRPNVVVETIKQAEDGRGVIVRLYESQRRRGTFRLETAFPLAAAWRTNLLEEDQERLAVEGQGVRAPIRPYQIMTLRLQLEAQPKETT